MGRVKCGRLKKPSRQRLNYYMLTNLQCLNKTLYLIDLCLSLLQPLLGCDLLRSAWSTNDSILTRCWRQAPSSISSRPIKSIQLHCRQNIHLQAAVDLIFLYEADILTYMIHKHPGEGGGPQGHRHL